MDQQHLTRAIADFLAEDIGSGDITTEAIFAGREERGLGRFVAKEDFVAAGLATVAAAVFTARNPGITIETAAADTIAVAAGDVVLEVSGPVADLLTAERVALNLAQRLCGIATLTARYVAAVQGLPVRIVDTRKTTPGLRGLEKYAVRAGGGHNHRHGLADGILVKDNHIAACGSISEAVRRVRQRAPHTLRLEVEASSLEQVRDCLACRVEAILLDNMSLAMLREAVTLAKGQALLEASGNVSLATVRAIAETGVDLISVGGLTHSAPAVDISMRITAAHRAAASGR